MREFLDTLNGNDILNNQTDKAQLLQRDLIRLLEVGENEQVEFKSSFDKEAIESLCAFANTTGGSILLGVDNQIKQSCSPSIVPESDIVIHSDYNCASESSVKIFDDHIEFYNPGKLSGGLSVQQLLSSNYTSSIRNKQLATLFKDAGLIERYGSGIKRVLESFDLYDLRPPFFEELQEGFRVTVFMDTQKTTQKTTTKDRILELLKTSPNMTRADLALQLSKSENTIKEHLANLKTEGRLKRVGSDKGGYWMVIINE